jgi:hypothetical protein
MSCGIYRIFCCLAEFDSSFKTLFNDQQVPDMYIVSALKISWKLAIERLFLEPKKHSTNFKILLPILSQINIFTCRPWPPYRKIVKIVVTYNPVVFRMSYTQRNLFEKCWQHSQILYLINEKLYLPFPYQGILNIIRTHLVEQWKP